MPEPHELLTSAEAGAILERGPRTVQRLADSGDLPVAKRLPGPNGLYLFRRADVEALAASRLAASSSGEAR